MPTISELVKFISKIPGDLRVYGPGWGSGRWFRPYYKAGNAWYGIDQDGNPNTCGDSQYNWQFLEEPETKRKTKVRRWLWATKTGQKWVMGGIFMSDDEAQKYRNERQTLEYVRKVVWSELEFDE